MAVCGECATRDNEVQTDKNGMYGRCGADSWIEWRDFSSPSLKGWTSDGSKNLGISFPELVLKVFKSEDDILICDAIHDIFVKFEF